MIACSVTLVTRPNTSSPTWNAVRSRWCGAPSRGFLGFFPFPGGRLLRLGLFVASAGGEPDRPLIGSSGAVGLGSPPDVMQAALAEAKVKNLRKGGQPWVFYEGPPTANGSPGLHHVWARVFKDLYPRFQTMRGRDVPRKGGWDCHGLPVELEIEKELGFTHKDDIEAYGIAKFNERCRDSVQRYVEDFAAVTQRAAVWIDTKDAYWTLSNDYIESVWWLVRQL